MDTGRGGAEDGGSADATHDEWTTAPRQGGAQAQEREQEQGDEALLMQQGKYQEAVSRFSSALSALPSTGGAAQQEQRCRLLLGRAAALAALSARLRDIPAAESECNAVFAPDPSLLAERSLADAKAALHLAPDCPRALLCQGQALVQLERYAAAEASFQRGLQLAPGDAELAAAAAACAAAAQPDGMAAQRHEAVVETCRAARERALADAECSLCMKLLWEPVTTPCGHTFCRPCLARAMDHSNRCPMCRMVLHVARELPVTITLKNLLEHTFSGEYEARGAEEAELAAAARPGGGGAAGAAPLPLFVMSPMLPGEKMALNIFEPRYRLMVRRCMEGGRRFGMATVDGAHVLHDVACEAEITECQPLPDGRFYLEIEGRRRFRAAETWEQDGYRVARPEYVKDTAVDPSSPEATELEAAAAAVELLADSWVARLNALAQTRRGVAHLLARVGDRPPASDPEGLSFWVANLVCPVLDDAAVKLSLLNTRCTLQRLTAVRRMLQQMRDSHCTGCSVM